MGRVGRPKKHRSVCFIEFKDDNGEKEAYVRVAKKFDRLTKDNYKKIFLQKGIENPYQDLFNTDDEDNEKGNDRAFKEELINEELSLDQVNQNKKLNEEDKIDSFEIFAPSIKFDDDENSLFYHDVNSCKTKDANIIDFEETMSDFIMTNDEISSSSIFF